MFPFSVTQGMVSRELGARVSSQPEGLRQSQPLVLLLLFLELPKLLIPVALEGVLSRKVVGKSLSKSHQL